MTNIKNLFLHLNSLDNKENETKEPPAKRHRADIHLNFMRLCPQEDDSEDESEGSDNEIMLEELKRYRKLKYNAEENSCPLKFYKENVILLPNLSGLASLVFCTTASSVPSECAFSTAGELINIKRTRLSPILAEDLLFLNKNDL